MRKIKVFNNISLDGYFTDAAGDMSWAHEGADAEWAAFGAENAKGGGELLFGRVTYELMASFWPTAEARATSAVIAEAMNEKTKLVASRTLREASWKNTRVLKGDLVEEARALKQASGPDVVIMGSGTVVSQLAQAGLIDEYQMVMTPVVLGRGRTMFEGVTKKARLTLKKTRAFGNGNVVLWYEPAR